MFKSESSMNFTMKFCEFVIHSDFIFLLLAAVTAQKPLTRQPSSSVELNPLDSGVSSLVGEKQFVCLSQFCLVTLAMAQTTTATATTMGTMESTVGMSIPSTADIVAGLDEELHPRVTSTRCSHVKVFVPKEYLWLVYAMNVHWE